MFTFSRSERASVAMSLGLGFVIAILSGCSPNASTAPDYDPAAQYQPTYKPRYRSDLSRNAESPRTAITNSSGVSPAAAPYRPVTAMPATPAHPTPAERDAYVEAKLRELGIPPRPTEDQLASADIGPKPTVEQLRETSERVLRGALKDYDSAKIELIDPSTKAILKDHLKTHSEESLVAFVRSYYVKNLDAKTTLDRYEVAWVGVVHVNAKNSYGGYTGFKQWAFYWRNGKYVHFEAPRS